MPVVDIPTVGLVEFPDSMSGSDIEKAIRENILKPQTTIGGYAKEAVKAIPRGLVGGLESAALGAAALLPGDTESGFESTVRERIKKLAERLKPEAAAGYEEAIPTKLGEAVGSIGSLIGTGGFGGLAARGLGLAAGAGRMAAVAPTAAAMGAGEARERAVSAGATPEQITSATQAGIIPGLSELLPVERMFRMLPKEMTGTIFNRLERAFVTGGFEGLQEGASAIAQNLIAQKIYKPSQELLEGVGEDAAYGAGAGAIVQFLVDAVAGRRAKKGAPGTEQPQEQPSKERILAEREARAESRAVPEQPVFYGTQEGDVLTTDESLDARARYKQQQSLQDELISAQAQYNALAEDDPDRVKLAETISTYNKQLDELGVEQKPIGEVTDATLKDIGFSAGAIKTSKIAKDLKTLDLSNLQDIDKFETLISDYGRKSKAKQPYDQAAVDNLINAARFRLSSQTEGAPDAAGSTVDRGSVGMPVSQQPAGGPTAPEPEAGGLAAPEGPANTVVPGEGKPSGALKQLGEVDPLFDQAVAVVLKTQRPSISLVQRNLRIGYNRAARLIEQMEQNRLISPINSKGVREVLAPAAPAPASAAPASAAPAPAPAVDTSAPAPAVDTSAPAPVALKGVLTFTKPETPDTAYLPEATLQTEDGTYSATGTNQSVVFSPSRPTKGSIVANAVSAEFDKKAGQTVVVYASSPQSGPIKVRIDSNYIELDAPNTGNYVRLSRDDRKSEAVVRKALGDDAVDAFLSGGENTVDQTATAFIGEDLGPKFKYIASKFEENYAAADSSQNTKASTAKTFTTSVQEEAPQRTLSDIEEVETAKEIAGTTKSKKDFNDAITYLSYFKNTTNPKVDEATKQAATDALNELNVPEAEVQAAWENIAMSEAAAQQELSEKTAEAASKREQRNLADQERRAKEAETRAAKTPIKKPITAKEKAQYASAEKRMVLQAPTDVPFKTAEDANALLETYLSDLETGDPARRKQTGFKTQIPAREYVTTEDRENIARLMQEGKFDDAHTAIAATVLRANTAARTAINEKDWTREVKTAESDYQLSHRPVGSGLSKNVTALLQKGDLKGALKLLSETGSTPVIRTAARKLLPAIKNTKVKIREIPTGDAGIYSATTDTIYVDPQGLHEHTLLHEAMHAAVSHVLANPNHVLTQKLQKLFDALSPEIRGQYGATNLQEFAAESISNQNFQDVLRGQPKGWWGRFVDAVRGFLGLSKATHVEKVLDQLLEAAPSEARREGVGVLKLPATAAMEAQAERRIAEKKREGDQGFFQQAWNFAFDSDYRVSKIKELRNNVVYNGAAFEEKMLEKNQLKSAVNLLLATRSMDLATSSILHGAISLDKQTGLFKVNQGPSLVDVYQEVQNIADKAGVSMDKAKAWFDLGATVLRMRSPGISPEIRKSMALSAADEAAANDVLAQYGAEIRAGVDKFQQYKNQLLQVGKETGRFTQEDVDEWIKAPEYVPWHRILDNAKFGYETKTSTKKYFKSLVDNGKVAELIGGDVNKRPIGDILGNMENLSFWLVNTVVRNHAANVAMDGLLKIDARALKTPQQGTPDRLVKTYRNGEPAYFEVADPLDRHAFLGVETVTTPIFKALGTAANWLRTGTTLMPGFVVSQLFQDGFRATALSGAKNPFMVGAKVIGSFGDALMNKGTAQELAAYGIIPRADFMSGLDRSRLDAALDKGGTGATKVRRAIGRALESMSRASDASQRIAIYEQTMKETGDKMLALYRASEIINFQRQGRSATINVLRQIIPFMNAYIQGLDITYRSMFKEGISGKDRTAAMRHFWSTGIKIAALASIYAVMVSDDDDYKKLPDHEKLTGFMVPGSRELIKELTGTDIGGNLKIPSPQDPIGFMFKTIPEQAWNYTMQLGTKDEVDATKLSRILKSGLLNTLSPPGAMPQMLKPTVEVVTNYSFFTGNPIIGKGIEGRSKDLQFTNGTSELAKALATVTPLAPVQIDHLVRGYLGVFGGTLMYTGGRAIEVATGIERADRRLADVPQVTTFLTSNAPAGLKDDYYEMRKKSVAVVDDIKALLERDPEEAKQRLMEGSNKELYMLAKSGFFTQVEQKLTQLRQVRRLVEGNQQMSSEEKREKLDQVDKYEMLLFSNLNLPTLRKRVGM